MRKRDEKTEYNHNQNPIEYWQSKNDDKEVDDTTDDISSDDVVVDNDDGSVEATASINFREEI